jgi:UDP-glucose 4-epimerase
LKELELNLRPTLALLQALQEHAATPLVYVSSGGTLYAREDDQSADEVSAIAPRSYHGAGKASAEHFVAAWCAQFAGSATIVRPSNLYGPGQSEKAGFGVIPTAFGKLLRGETMHVWGDGSAMRDYLYIDDFVHLCLALADAPLATGMRVVNACSGTSVNLHDLFDAVESVTGEHLSRCFESSRIVDALRVNMDASLARKLYGWTPSTSLLEGLRRTWEWFRTTQH